VYIYDLLLNNTPVFDIKPYLSYSDAIPDAIAAYATEKPSVEHVIHFSELAKNQCLDAN
jgi:tRNA (Thr-GGU) A37 N-methylase